MLNKTDIYNLLVFLKRTTVQGMEVPTYSQLVNKLEIMLNTPEDVPKEVQNE